MNILGSLKNINFSVKTFVSTFWATLETFGQLFIPTSGHGANSGTTTNSCSCSLARTPYSFQRRWHLLFIYSWEGGISIDMTTHIALHAAPFLALICLIFAEAGNKTNAVTKANCMGQWAVYFIRCLWSPPFPQISDLRLLVVSF